MKKKTIFLIITGSILIMALSACQAASSNNTVNNSGGQGNLGAGGFQGTRQFNGTGFPRGAGGGGSFRATAEAEGTTVFQFNGTAFPGGFQGNGTRSPQGNTGTGQGRQGQNQQGTPAPQETPTVAATPTATATVESDITDAEAALTNYFTDLQKTQFDQASQLVSIYSLAVDQMTRSDAQTALTNQVGDGAAWSDLKIVGAQELSDNTTVLVHVTYTYGVADKKENRDEVWPMRNEAGQWVYNWNNLIDYHTLDNAPETTYGLTIIPQILYRYADHMELSMMIQNSTNNLIVLGQSNEILGTLHFSGQTVKSESTKIAISPLRTYLDERIDFKGSFDTYPTSVDIRTWTNYSTPPWYTFTFSY